MLSLLNLAFLLESGLDRYRCRCGSLNRYDAKTFRESLVVVIGAKFEKSKNTSHFWSKPVDIGQFCLRKTRFRHDETSKLVSRPLETI
jgi:hypothetical protein